MCGCWVRVGVSCATDTSEEYSASIFRAWILRKQVECSKEYRQHRSLLDRSNHQIQDESHKRIMWINLLTPNDDYSGRTAPLTSKCCILYIYSTNISTEYFKHGIYSPFFPLQNAVCSIILTYLVPVLFTCYIQDVLKFKKIIPAPKG